MRFEWDENKNNSNEEKHRLNFEIAIEVFSDTKAITDFNRDANGEIREQIIGSIAGEILVLFVVYTKRADTVRVISARRANKKERLLYEKN